MAHNDWMFCFVCLERFEQLEPLVEHIVNEKHQLSRDQRAEFRQVQDLVGTALGNYKLVEVQ